MLTVTKTEEGFSVSSTLFETFEEGDTFIVSLLSNCCGEAEETSFTTVEDSVLIETDWLNVEGVYTFTLTYTSGETVTVQKTCYFNEIDLACNVGTFALADCTSDVPFDYFMLIQMQNCACSCDNMCEIYKRILKKINKEFCCDEITQQPCETC